MYFRSKLIVIVGMCGAVCALMGPTLCSPLFELFTLLSYLVPYLYCGKTFHLTAFLRRHAHFANYCTALRNTNKVTDVSLFAVFLWSLVLSFIFFYTSINSPALALIWFTFFYIYLSKKVLHAMGTLLGVYVLIIVVLIIATDFFWPAFAFLALVPTLFARSLFHQYRD
jgi:hypothetical protein